ncbi:tyrosine-type recombinase/integrase [Carnimonas bestiolae]|uniref:tyrosine-type recombinase/integrase n=1 Tax=Carnimonas bestiolae TaxID=3402172 RepID=UPI003EDC3625
MPYKRPDSAHYWVAISPPGGGKKIRRSTGTSNREEARALEGKWRAQLYQQQHWDRQPDRYFEDVLLMYLEHAQDLRSFETIRHQAKRLREHFSGREMSSLAAQDIRDYIRFRRGANVSNATINRELALLSSAINHAVTEYEWRLPNPVKGRMLREPEARIRWITEAEAARLEQEVRNSKRFGDQIGDFVRLALNTGMRMNEMLQLDWRRVDFVNSLVWLEAEHTKSARRRSVPLNDTAIAVLRNRKRFCAEHCPGSRWVFSKSNGDRLTSIRSTFKTACARAGIDNFRIHDLRHTCAAWLVSKGVPMMEIKDLLGHSSVTMTEKYAHLSPNRVRDAVNKLQSRFGHVENLVSLEDFAGGAKKKGKTGG